MIKDIHKLVSESLAAWDKATGRVNKPPYQADSPCYYCQFVDWPNVLHNACNYCIHNPEAVIYNEVSVTND